MGISDFFFGTKKRTSSNYAKGIRAEKKIKHRLEEKGYIVRQSKGSRGPYDLYAMKSGKKLLVQVKSGQSSASSEEIRKLRTAAKNKNAKALIMKYNKGKIKSRFVY